MVVVLQQSVCANHQTECTKSHQNPLFCGEELKNDLPGAKNGCAKCKTWIYKIDVLSKGFMPKEPVFVRTLAT